MTYILLSVILFLAPLVPDVKLTRPKLLLLETGLYAALFLWLVVSFSTGKMKIRKSLLAAPLAAYGALNFVFFLLSPDKIVALSELKRALLSITAYLVAVNAADEAWKRKIVIGAWIGGSFLSMLYGLLQHSGGFWMVEVPKMGRIMSTSGNPILFAACLVVILPVVIGVGWAMVKKSAGSAVPFIIILAAGLFALYFTQTRAAFIAFGVSLMVFLALGARSHKFKLALFGGLVLAGVVFGFATRQLWSRQQEHLLIWRDTLTMWSHYPLTGTGPGTFHIYFPNFASDQLKSIWPQGTFIVNDAHNEYVQYLSETGIIGFGILIWLLSAFFANAKRVYSAANDEDRKVVTGLIASAAGILTMNFFSVDMRFIISAVYLFTVMGLLDSFGNDFYKVPELSRNARYAGAAASLIAAGFAFPAVLRPYIAQRNVAAAPDFFQQQVLDAGKTIEDLEAIAAKYPNEPTVFEKLGWVYAKQRNFPKAIENLERSAKLNPNNPGPLNNIGNIYFLQNDRPKAISYWKRSLEIKPEQLDSRLNLATAFYYNGQLKEAVDQLKIVLKLYPNNEQAIVMLKQMTE